jgi:hypothetical protein
VQYVDIESGVREVALLPDTASSSFAVSFVRPAATKHSRKILKSFRQPHGSRKNDRRGSAEIEGAREFFPLGARLQGRGELTPLIDEKQRSQTSSYS